MKPFLQPPAERLQIPPAAWVRRRDVVRTFPYILGEKSGTFGFWVFYRRIAAGSLGRAGGPGGSGRNRAGGCMI